MLRLIYLLAFLFCHWFAKGQDFHFAQAIQQPFLVNPASAGHQTEQSMRLAILTRAQWANPGTTQAYQGFALTLEWRHCISNARHFFALGLSAQSDGSTLGGFSNRQLLPAFAYHVHLDRDWFLAAGGSVGALNYSLRGDNLRFDAQYQNGYFNADRDDREDLDGNGRTVIDMGAGVEGYNNRLGMSFGFSWLHLNQPAYSFLDEENRLGISFISHGTISSNPRNKKAIAAKWVLRRQSFNGNNSQQWTLLAGPMGQQLWSKYGAAQFGVYLRCGSRPNSALTINAIVPTMTYQTRDWSVSISYDANVSGLRTRFAGGMEIWLNYNFGNFDKCVNCAFGR